MTCSLDYVKQNIYDVSSFSNFNKICQKEFKVDIFINFEENIFEGLTVIDFEILDNNENKIILDTKKLFIESVYVLDKENIKELNFYLQEKHPIRESLGTPLIIDISNIITYSNKLKIFIQYRTLGGDGIQWLSKYQTLTGKHPFVFTQGEPILARTILPCQDSPGCKALFKEVNLIVEKGITALFGGLLVSSSELKSYTSLRNKTYKNCIKSTFTQNVEIPTYLFTIVAGELAYKKISNRVGIYSEVPLIEKAKHEFNEAEKYIQAAEKYLDYPYVWGNYNMLILPQAFPFGGMENPNLTFLNSGLLIGDKSMLQTVAHEIAHSWTGNLVTNKNWNNFWMNEGFTVFMERKLIEITKNKEHALLEADVGYNELLYAVRSYGKNHKYTALYPNINDEDPDDAFSVVPYEKGFNLLFYLEKCIGENNFRDILRKYIKKYAYRCVEFDDFKNLFEEEIKNKKLENKLSTKNYKFNWNSWVYEPGYLNIEELGVCYDTNLSKKAKDLYNEINNSKNSKDISNISNTYKSLHPNVKIVFFNLFLNNILDLSENSFDVLKKSTNILNDFSHPEIAYTYFQIAFIMKDEESIDSGVKFLKCQGRMKYIRPVYVELYRFKKDYCRKVFEDLKHLYHAIPIRLIKTDFEDIDNGIK